MKSTLLSRPALLRAASPALPATLSTGAVELRKGELFRMTAPADGTRIRVLEGVLWITEAGDRRDHVVSTGEVFVSSRAGRIVAESLPARTRLAWSHGCD